MISVVNSSLTLQLKRRRERFEWLGVCRAKTRYRFASRVVNDSHVLSSQPPYDMRFKPWKPFFHLSIRSEIDTAPSNCKHTDEQCSSTKKKRKKKICIIRRDDIHCSNRALKPKWWWMETDRQRARAREKLSCIYRKMLCGRLNGPKCGAQQEVVAWGSWLCQLPRSLHPHSYVPVHTHSVVDRRNASGILFSTLIQWHELSVCWDNAGRSESTTAAVTPNNKLDKFLSAAAAPPPTADSIRLKRFRILRYV